MNTEAQLKIKERVLLLKTLIKDRILVLDGAMGTALQDKNLSAKDFGGEEFEGCNEHLVLTRPDVIADIHKEYLKVGADIIETNTFGGTPLVLAEYNLQDKYFEINKTAAEIARRVADEMTLQEPHKPRFVAGSIGPTTKALSVTGGTTFEELEENFYLQAKALYEGGIDYYLIETCQDTRNIKAAIIGINRAMAQYPYPLPLAVSGTIEPMGTMLAGQSIEALISSLEHIDLLYMGLNCATGPEFMTDHIRSLSQYCKGNVACLPNAGLPDENGHYLETPESMSQVLERFIDQGWINILGGCCGTTAKHIEAFAKLVQAKKPRSIQPLKIPTLSGIDLLEVTDEKRPLLVGERTNVIGSKKFREMIASGQFDEAAEIAKEQVKKGAHVIDVCLANPDRDELTDMKLFLEKLIQKVRVPLMIDSTDEIVVELALTYSQGKAIINSINLEDGEERFEKIIPLAKKYGAALVVGTIDEDPLQGMAVTRQRKLDVATRSYQLLTEKYGIKEEDIYWDTLVFPCATGDENYIGSALETIEGLRLIKQRFPNTKSVLGISNVSFGLPAAGREVLNSVFLHDLTKAGLDMAIVNTQGLRRYSTIPEGEILLARNLLENKGQDPIGAFTAFYRGKTQVSKDKDQQLAGLTIHERVSRYILEGIKKGMIEDLNELHKEMRPLDIINGPLMKGMAKVGELFNDNQLIVAEVLQSAEVMKYAVNHLEQFMEKVETSSKGKVLLATVKGDVHDIGKNLVDIILSNNGYQVINLGIKITSDQLIEAYNQHHPDIIGLSGLLVKSAQQMILTTDDLAKAGINVPILVGGAALSLNFVQKKILPNYPTGHVFYAKDAMNGLDLANKVLNEQELEELKRLQKSKVTGIQNPEDLNNKNDKVLSTQRSSMIEIKDPFVAPDYQTHILLDQDINEIYEYINPLMLYGRHLGIKGKIVRGLSEGQTEEVNKMQLGPKAIEIYQEVQNVKSLYAKEHLKAKGVYQFFKANSEGNTLYLYNEDEELLKSLTFPRQAKGQGLCLADFVCPKEMGTKDNIAMFVVSVGQGIREKCESLKLEGQYLHSHILAALALEAAEGYAELLHSQLRAMWGFPDPQNLSKMDMFQAKYHGKRFSFGYPACPNLEDQDILFELLEPTKNIGVELTEGHMMDPESSVSAIVFAHPQATYFTTERDL